MNHKLTDSQIETMLNQIQPEPGAGLHRRMAKAPWNAAPVYRMKPLQKLAMAAAALVLLMVAMVYTPLGTLAQELLNAFTRANGNTVPYSYTVNAEPTPAAEVPVYQPETLAAVEAQAGFDVLAPEFVPAGYAFEGADFAGGMASLYYRIPGDMLGRNLVIQQAHEGVDNGLEIGADAVVESVEINGISGEYVKGWWLSNGEIRDNGVHSGEMTWTPALGFHFLRWNNDGIQYAILFQESGNVTKIQDTTGEPGYLTLADLVTVAESLR